MSEKKETVVMTDDQRQTFKLSAIIGLGVYGVFVAVPGVSNLGEAIAAFIAIGWMAANALYGHYFIKYAYQQLGLIRTIAVFAVGFLLAVVLSALFRLGSVNVLDLIGVGLWLGPLFGFLVGLLLVAFGWKKPVPEGKEGAHAHH